MEETYHVADGDRMHGPLTYEQFAALLDSGTLSAEARWMTESEREFRPVSDLAIDPEVIGMAAAPPVLSPPMQAHAAPVAIPVQPVVVVMPPGQQRSTTAARVPAGGIAAIAAVVVAPVVLSIIGFFALVVVVLIAVGLSGSTTTKDNASAKVTAKVFVQGATVFVENTNTNQWNRGELILDPAGDRYRVRMEGIPPARLAEFDLAEFATTAGNRFPAAAKVPRMVEVRVDGMASSVYLLQ